MKELSEIIQEMVDNGNSMGQMDLKTAQNIGIKVWTSILMEV
jgi:hypothetical protein